MKQNRQANRTMSRGKAEGLCRHELFRDLPKTRIAALERESFVKEFPAGHLFFQPGGTGNSLYLLERGRVETFRSSGRKKLIIAELQPPAIFGEMACVGARVYHCFARATEACQVRMLPKKNLEAILEKYPGVARGLLDLVSRRFVGVLMDLDAASFQQLIPRLARLLLERAEGEFVGGMTHAAIAEYLRVYRESATSALGELRKAGIVALERKRIRILDRDRLERAARESVYG
jgi:CRP-like cAMP-binding protein